MDFESKNLLENFIHRKQHSHEKNYKSKDLNKNKKPVVLIGYHLKERILLICGTDGDFRFTNLKVRTIFFPHQETHINMGYISFLTSNRNVIGANTGPKSQHQKHNHNIYPEILNEFEYKSEFPRNFILELTHLFLAINIHGAICIWSAGLVIFSEIVYLFLTWKELRSLSVASTIPGVSPLK